MSLPDFRNEPFTDFNTPQNAAAMEQALAAVRAQLGQTYPLVIGGERITTEQTIASINPARPDEVVGRVASATVELANRAIETANQTFQSWRKVPAEQRAAYLFKAADEMRRRKLELAAWLVYEVSKSWAEADGDIAEAIDFCEFYGREMLRLAGPQAVLQLPGEQDEMHYIPLGAGVAIPPWNFPGAIMVGLVVAPVVAGNTVVLKPASTSPIIAAKFIEVLEAVGLPPGVVNFLPGPGGSVGDALVDHPKTRFIAFTGSKEIGLRIFERASRTPAGPALAQAHGSGDGRQGYDRRRRDRRPGHSRRWDRRLGLRLPGPEVLGLLTRRGRRAGLRPVAGEGRRAYPQAGRRRPDRAGHLYGRGDRPEVAR